MSKSLPEIKEALAEVQDSLDALAHHPEHAERKALLLMMKADIRHALYVHTWVNGEQEEESAE